MPFAYIAREEVQKFAGQVVDPRTKRRVPPSVRALYVCAYLCIPTNGPESEKAENEREVTQARSKFARDTGYSERTVQRAYKILERCGLIRFTHRAGPANVHTREWQRFTLPKAPVGHWRVLVPRAVRRERARQQADRQRRSQRILDRLGAHTGDGSAIGLAVQKIDAIEAAAAVLPTETKSLPLPLPQREVSSAAPRLKEERGLRRELVSSSEQDERGYRRELSPGDAAARARDWDAKLKAKLASAERRAAGVPDPDNEPDPH